MRSASQPSGPEHRRPQFTKQSAFHRGLQERVSQYFAGHALSPHAKAAMYLKTSVILLWFGMSYALFLLGSATVPTVILLAVTTGLAVAGLGFCVQHDGGHGAYSETKWINRAMAFVLDLLGASSYVWRYKHNVLHHTYTNIDGVDDDICIAPLARLTPGQPHHYFHRWQHLYIWGFYALITLKWHWWDDFHNIATGRIGGQKFPRPRGKEIAAFVVGRVTFFAWALALPIAVHGFKIALLYYVLTQAVAGVILASVFQLAHCVEDVAWPQRPEENAPAQRLLWAEHQLATTVDVARHNRFVTWYLGGLNFQAVHHLFPRICHIHYPALSNILERTCAEFGVTYLTRPTVWQGLASHYRWLREMGCIQNRSRTSMEFPNDPQRSPVRL